ncbi:hypothetical protein LCGC14_0842630 [marine sediment metagenome]|uniref:Uncharacterized protein n=1 Tax=marine sediment metagenome TaxID=412755 RepID=A0A0F9PCN9_9ZZZZ
MSSAINLLREKSSLTKCYIVIYNDNMGGIKSKLDFEQLRKEIRELNNRKALYRLLKEELGKIDHWKQKARGDPVKAYLARGKVKQGIAISKNIGDNSG